MQIEISDDTYRLLCGLAASQGLSASAIPTIVDEQVRRAAGQTVGGERPTGLVERFRKYRGALRGSSIAEIVADRHRGLAS